MLPGWRGPVWPSRAKTPISASGLPSCAAMASPMASAVPEGASTLWRWWASMTSMSVSASICVASSMSRMAALTPGLMLAACTMAMSCAACWMRVRCSAEKPVVPMTIFTPCCRQASR